MFGKNRHPGDDTPRKGERHAPHDPDDSSRKAQKKPRRQPAPLWQPKSDPRDVNLEMTPDDLDRSAESHPARPHRVPPAKRNRKPPESADVPGLGQEWRERIMPRRRR